MVETVFSRS